MLKKFLKLEEASQLLGMSKSKLYKLTSSNEIPYYKPGGIIYFLESELEDWILKSRVDSRKEKREKLLNNYKEDTNEKRN